jgi:hypothetical protein
MKFEFTENRVIPTKKESDEEGDEEEDEEKREEKTGKKNEDDPFRTSYFSFLDSVNCDHSKCQYPLRSQVSFSNVFTPDFIFRVIYCLMFEITKIEVVKSSNSKKYVFNLFVQKPSLKKTISSTLKQLSNLLQIFEDLNNLSKIRFLLN